MTTFEWIVLLIIISALIGWADYQIAKDAARAVLKENKENETNG